MITNHRTNIGKLLYSFEMRWVKFLSKHRWLWYILNLTWGILYSIAGLVIYLFVLLSKRKTKDFRSYRYAGKVRCTQFGNNWGGLSSVFFIFVANNMGKEYTVQTKMHELGHTFQNALFGPFIFFFVIIPSVCRYWYITLKERKGRSFAPNWYDNAWFEGSASDGGRYYVSTINKGATDCEKIL